MASEANKKQADVIDLTKESSSDEDDTPPKRKCVYKSGTRGSQARGFVNFKVSCYSVMSQIN